MLENPKNPVEIRQHLSEGRVVALSVQTYPFWTDAATWKSGDISLPLGEPILGGHAILLVGFNEQEEHFIFRNSWSDVWASESTYARGYGTLPYAYVELDGWEGFS